MKLLPNQSVLVLVDLQERLIAAMDGQVGTHVIQNVERLVLGAAALNIPVVVTEQYPKGLGSTVEAVLKALAPVPDHRVVEKVHFDATEAPHFAEIWGALAGVRPKRSVILCGMESHICVYQTARGLVNLGHSVHVVDDATCSRSSDNHRLARDLWNRAGAIVSGTETILFDLLGKAGGDAFKAISKAVR